MTFIKKFDAVLYCVDSTDGWGEEYPCGQALQCVNKRLSTRATVRQGGAPQWLVYEYPNR